MPTLTPKQKLFKSAYLANGMNATQAAITAGYSKKTAKSQGARLLTNVDIRDAIAGRSEKALAKIDFSVDRTLEFVARLAFFDPKDLFEDDGSMKRMQDIPEEVRTVIAGLEVSDIWDSGEGEQKSIIGIMKKIKLSDRLSALDKLMRYHSLYRDKVEHTGKITLESLVSGSLDEQ